MTGLKTIEVHVQNFQSVEDLRFEITGFTCITGPSNIGKSALVRALSGALLNSSVVGAVRKGKKHCTVEMKSEDWGVKWEKGERVGRYWLPGEDKARDGIGQGQTEFTSSLGFRSIKVGAQHITPWLADQFHPIFLLDQSGPSVTDFISDITRLKVLQNAITINARMRQRQLQSAQAAEDEARRLEGIESKYSPVDQVAAVEQDLVSQMESVAEYERVVEELRRYSDRMESESAVIQVLSGSKRVRVPAEEPDPTAEIVELVRQWTLLESSAMAVFRLRDCSSLVVPDAPEGEFAELESASRFLAISPLRESVAALEPAASLRVPEEVPGTEEVAALASVMARIDAARAGVAALSAELPEVPDVDHGAEAESLRLASVALSAMDAEQREISRLDAELVRAQAELEAVDLELSAIPTCPECGQVTAPHSHP